MSTNCLSTPLSWLTLERYQLGELPREEATRAEAHLRDCRVCAECLRSLEQEVSLPALPPLPGSQDSPQPAREPSRWTLPWPWLGVGLAGAAAVFLVTLLPARLGSPPSLIGYPASTVSYKGGELSLAIVRQRAGQITHMPRRVRSGDRLKVELTCPASETLRWDVAVIDADGVSFPLQADGIVQCGNRIPLPGAFAIDSTGEVWICAMVAKQLPSRKTLTEQLSDRQARDSVCHRLESRIGD